MKIRLLLTSIPLVLLLTSCAASQGNPAVAGGEGVAPVPPMGWNSYDYFGSWVTEAEFLAEVDYMQEHMLAYGWKYAVIDYLWANPTGATSVRPGKDGRPRDTLAMDAYGRLMPAVNRFPSAAGGKGFKPIADYVHARGLKFGIHIMRGIPRQAFWEKRPVLGTSVTAHEVADTAASRFCWWNNNMYTVDTSSTEGQAYYNSLIDLYVSWEIDFLKVDDIAAPPYREAEIAMIRKAIDRCGRPIVLSLSPGDTPLEHAAAVTRQANMWRVSNDMWDKWSSLLYQFDRLDKWSPYIQANHWPDADMLPIGHLSRGGKPDGPDRMSRLTMDETRTLLALWALARSPLIMGGDLLTSPQEVLDLLKNRDFIRVDQHSRDNRQVERDTAHAIWMARDSIPGTVYVGLFNLAPAEKAMEFSFPASAGLKGHYAVHDIWKGDPIGTVEGTVRARVAPHGVAFLKLVHLP